MNNTLYKEEQLIKYLSQLPNVAIGFSGGVDSTYLLAVAQEVLGKNVVAFTIDSDLQTNDEVEFAIEFAKQLKVRHIVIKFPILTYEDVKKNDASRCYHCKKLLFTGITSKAKEYGISTIADGTNTDDYLDYRPGLKACDELGVIHPLADVNLSKTDIRTLSTKRGLTTATKPAFACLASRIPYGIALDANSLSQVENAERILRELGFRQYRVRHHGSIARVEVLEDQFSYLLETRTRNQIVSSFQDLGFKFVALDIKGYQTGSMNRVLEGGNK